jgi:signal transduction histidine kinase
VDQSTVLIISDDADFSRSVIARWQSERIVPAFTLLGGELWPRFTAEGFDIAVVGPLHRDLLSIVMEPLHSTAQQVFCLCQDEVTAQLVRRRWPRIAVLPPSHYRLDVLVLAGGEAVGRARAEARARAAEHAVAAAQCEATLGRYMLEMRHNLNNALTSLIGNSELLLLEPGSLSAGARAQMSTIHSMALRINEILQRFSSLEKEMHAVARQTRSDSLHVSAAAAGD